MYLKDKSKFIGLRISEEDFEKIKSLSETYNLSISDTIRKLIFSILTNNKGVCLNDESKDINN